MNILEQKQEELKHSCRYTAAAVLLLYTVLIVASDEVCYVLGTRCTTEVTGLGATGMLLDRCTTAAAAAAGCMQLRLGGQRRG